MDGVCFHWELPIFHQSLSPQRNHFHNFVDTFSGKSLISQLARGVDELPWRTDIIVQKLLSPSPPWKKIYREKSLGAHAGGKKDGCLWGYGYTTETGLVLSCRCSLQKQKGFFCQDRNTTVLNAISNFDRCPLLPIQTQPRHGDIGYWCDFYLALTEVAIISFFGFS